MRWESKGWAESGTGREEHVLFIITICLREDDNSSDFKVENRCESALFFYKSVSK